jgi:hypothetical protein
MGMSRGTAGLAIAAGCFLPANASAIGGTFLLDRDRLHVSTVSSPTASNLLPLMPNFSRHGANAVANKSINAGLPCPGGRPWQAADSTQEPIRQKSAKPNATPMASNKSASTSKTSRSGTDNSIIFVGGKKAQASTKAPTAAAKARTGELRHNQSNTRREEMK